MMKRFFTASTILLAAVGISHGEAQRTLLTYENKSPELHQWEAGLLAQNREFETRTLTSFAPYARYGLIENLTVYGDVPFASSDADFGEDGSGLGDARLGLQLLAYHDVFGYPWVTPHVDTIFATGDEDKALGNGENAFMFGVSVGSTMYDQLHFIVDLSYALNGAPGSATAEDQTLVSGSIVWDVDERFAVLAEGRMSDEGTANDHPLLFQGGMVYKFTESLGLGIYAGSWTESEEDVDVTGKLSYTF